LPTILSRRDLLKQFTGMALGAGCFRPIIGWATDTAPVNESDMEGMIVRSARFIDLEMPSSYFESLLTPIPHFLVRNHMHEPSTWDAAAWRLTIDGEVQNRLNNERDRA
jgi:DMSO/TMAO reductase YedYZ molybdopterin-dependent catalytic subunit